MTPRTNLFSDTVSNGILFSVSFISNLRALFPLGCGNKHGKPLK
jgi:hypothetical protein